MFPWRETPVYIISQIAGALLGAFLLSLFFPDAQSFGVTLPQLPLLQSFLVEVLLTFFLMFVITGVATDSRAIGTMAGAAIGATVTVGALVGGPLTGASMNPARSIGPAVVSGQLDSLWLYILAPILGAALGALTYRYIRCEEVSEKPDPEAAGCC